MINSLLNYLQELNLEIDQEDQNRILDYYNKQKRIGIIGLKGLEDLTGNLSLLPYHPDLFDTSAKYSNFENLKLELEDNYDLIVLISNKEEIFSLEIPIIHLKPKNLILEIIGENSIVKISDWFKSLNIDPVNIKLILDDRFKDRQLPIFLERKEVKSIDHISYSEKEEYLLEQAKINENIYSIFEVPYERLQRRDHTLYYFKLFSEEDLTLEQLNLIENTDYVFIHSRFLKLKDLIDTNRTEVIFFSSDNIDKVTQKIKSLLKKGSVLLVTAELFKENEFNNLLADYSENLRIIPSLGLIDHLKAIFGPRLFENYIYKNVDSSFYNLKLNETLQSLILEGFSKLSSKVHKKWMEWIKTQFSSDQLVCLYNNHSDEGYVTMMEFIKDYPEFDVLIIPSEDIKFTGELFI